MPKLPSVLSMLAALVCLAMVTPGHAEIAYPWCAVYAGGNSGTNCGFTSHAQCMASVSGIGGTCFRNAAFRGRPRPVLYDPSINLGAIDAQYPWCATYSGRGGGGGSNCGFMTRKQCMETISGIGGVCTPNALYEGPPAVRYRKKTRAAR